MPWLSLVAHAALISALALGACSRGPEPGEPSSEPTPPSPAARTQGSVVGEPIADPALDTFVRKAAVTGVLRTFDRMTQALIERYAASRELSPDGTCQLVSPSAAPVPAAHCCGPPGDSDRDGECEPSPDAWDAEPWRSLGFAVRDAQPFVYRLEVAPDPDADDGAQLVRLLAHGDLDCDGVRSTFTQHLWTDPSSPACVFRFADTILREQELE